MRSSFSFFLGMLQLGLAAATAINSTMPDDATSRRARAYGYCAGYYAGILAMLETETKPC